MFVMVARTRTKRAKRPKKPTSKYRPHFPDMLRMLVIECGLVNREGAIAWSKIAKAMNASVESLRNWRDPRKKKLYKKEFAKAAKEAREATDAGNIKRSLIQRAKGYIRTKKTVTISETEDGDFTTTRTEREKMLGDVAAGRICLANLGKPEDRWLERQELQTPGDKLTDEDRENVRKILAENQK